MFWWGVVICSTFDVSSDGATLDALNFLCFSPERSRARYSTANSCRSSDSETDGNELLLPFLHRLITCWSTVATADQASGSHGAPGTCSYKLTHWRLQTWANRGPTGTKILGRGTLLLSSWMSHLTWQLGYLLFSAVDCFGDTVCSG